MEQQGYKKRVGNRGEDAAASYLLRAGYRIVARNWHCKCGELDIVAVKGEIIAFVEVKTRQSNAMVTPLEAVNFRKQQRVVRSAAAYMCYHHPDLQPRFDVAAVTVIGEDYAVEYWQAAFDASAVW